MEALLPSGLKAKTNSKHGQNYAEELEQEKK